MDPTEERTRAGARSAAIDRPRVVISSDQGLIAETVAAGLASRDLQVEVVPWWPETPVPRPRRRTTGPEVPVVLLIVCDVAPRSRLVEARIRGTVRGVPWVVMTECARGPAWGALLEAGADAVVTSTISLSELVDALRAVLHGDPPTGQDERAHLVREWRSAERSPGRLRARMDSLSPREEEVLWMLYEGITVRTIAGRLGISEATVRSQVKNVLRKLAVGSQLAAVAAAEEFRQEDEPPD